MEYENKQIIDQADEIAKGILKEEKHMMYRDHFFPEMIKRLDLKIGVEIGVDKADFSKHILSKSNIDYYYCVDTWQDSFGSNCKPGYFDPKGDVRFTQACETLKEYLIEPNPRAYMMRMTSEEASNEFPDNSMDFCYIDGDHSLFGISKDVQCWIPKLRLGGIIGFHDYKDGPRSGINDYFGKQLDYKIKTVVDEYCNRYGYKLNVVGGRILNCWFVKNR